MCSCVSVYQICLLVVIVTHCLTICWKHGFYSALHQLQQSIIVKCSLLLDIANMTEAKVCNSDVMQWYANGIANGLRRPLHLHTTVFKACAHHKCAPNMECGGDMHIQKIISAVARLTYFLIVFIKSPRDIHNMRISRLILWLYFSDHSVVLTEDTDSFIIGERVWVGGTKPGQIAYIGETQFAPGEWAGIVLDDPIGKEKGHFLRNGCMSNILASMWLLFQGKTMVR